MKKPNLLQSQIFLACCLVVGGAHAQINFRGDTIPTGDFGGRQDFTGNVTVGNFDDGTLNITSGGVFNQVGRALIAQAAGSTATVNVSGGGEWRLRDLTLGTGGAGSLNITNGGKVFSSNGSLGLGVGSEGIATVSGQGSSWTIPIEHNSDFWIGNGGGSGILRILNGGTVTTTSDVYTTLDSASSSAIEIDGANSTLSARELCWLGMLGPTSVNITNGGTFSCGQSSYLAWGNVSLSGNGSKWVIAGDLDLGRHVGNSRGVLDIGEGSAVEVAGSVNMALSNTTTRNGSGALNIEGSASPGVLRTAQVVFGTYSVNSINFKHTSNSGNYQFSPSITGTGIVNVLGRGITVLTGNNAFNGGVNIQAGVLRAGSAGALSKNAGYNVRQAGTLDANRYSPTIGGLTHAGTLSLGAGDTSAALTTTNDYRGIGGSVHLNTALGGNASATQKLIVAGSTFGTTTLNIRNLGGAGAQTTGNGILVVQVGANSNGQFSLPAPGYVQAGAFRYTLAKVGRNWYLQSAPSNAKTAAADDGAACTAADPLAPACAVTPGKGSVATAAKPAALTASAAEAAAATTDASADTDASIGLDGLKDGDAVRMGDAVPVPGLGVMGMMSLSSIMGIAGLRRSRKLA